MGKMSSAITVEGGEIAEGHAEDHEAAAEQKNDDGGEIDSQGDADWRTDAEDGEADIPGLGVRAVNFSASKRCELRMRMSVAPGCPH